MARSFEVPRLTAPRLRAPRLPDSPWLAAAGKVAARQLAAEVFGAPGYGWTLAHPRAEGFTAAPRDFRPADAEAGRTVLAGRFMLAGAMLDGGPLGDPFNRPSPTRPFAVQLHRFAWLPHLMTAGERAPREALRLILLWRQTFGRWSPFAWNSETLPRRVFNLACAARRLSAVAAEEDRAQLADLLARQARHLLRLPDDRAWAAEHAAAAAVAGAALSGAAGAGILRRALRRLRRALPRAVLADGGHVSRSPEAGLELLLDLLTLDDALLQLGHEAPPELGRAIDRLTAGLRTLTLADGRLARFQGGEASTAARVDAARAHDETGAEAAAERLPNAGYERLTGQLLQVTVDAAAPARGPWAVSACAQPLALEIVCGRDRIITNSGWSDRAPELQGFRLTPAGSTLSLGEASVMQPLAGALARILGPRLQGAPPTVRCERRESDGAVLLELSHDGWVRTTGLVHHRRLYLDQRLDELRAEERLAPEGPPPGPLAVPWIVRFHLEPGATASLARDHKSVLVRGGAGRGWWFRSDAPDVALEPSVCFEHGLTRRSLQIVLRGSARTDVETRIRWKLSPAGASEGLT